MFNINSKTSIQKYLIFCSSYNVFNVNVSDFYMYFTTKNKNLSVRLWVQHFIE